MPPKTVKNIFAKVIIFDIVIGLVFIYTIIQAVREYSITHEVSAFTGLGNCFGSRLECDVAVAWHSGILFGLLTFLIVLYAIKRIRGTLNK